MLTPSQEKALGLNHHLCVTANAGSGKTRVLVERYIHIIASGCAEVSEVVAITFTEKAASELRRKIADGIVEKIKTAATVGERRHLEAVRAQLSSALISTIHGFCSRILREYPVEANVDAAFSVLEGIDQEFLLQECIHEVFYGVLKKNENPSLKLALVEVLRTKGKPAVVHLLHQLVHKREMMDALTGQGGIYNLPDEEILHRWHNAIAERTKNVFDDPVFLADMEVITGLAVGKNASEVHGLLSQFGRSRTLAAQAEAFAGMSGLMFTKSWDLLKAFTGKSAGLSEPSDTIRASILRLCENAEYLAPYVSYLSHEESHQQHRRLLFASRCMLDLYQRVSERYEERKREAGQLDFDDLQLCMRNLLQREPVRVRLSHTFKYIMVDEYQDTNVLQYQIVLPLLEQLKVGNLFIVGDPKQSIYGFRDADVAVFDRTAEDIKSAGGEEVVLAESFRPLKDVAAFVNLVFSSSMTGVNSTGMSYEVRYDELVQARQNTMSGKVELLLQYKEAPPGVDTPLPEADLIARKILSIVNEKVQVFDKEEASRGVEFRDCAILLRSRAKLSEIENALVGHAIPYVITAGTGYYQTQDIFDFYNYFSFLVNPSDDIALAGILRSPFFSVSDTELYESASERRLNSLWQHLHQASSLPDSLQRALGILKEDLAVGLRLTVSDLINRIVRQTMYLAIIAGLPRGDQCLANLQKLRRLATTFESRGLTNLYDFIGRLKQLIEEQEQEGQAAIDIQSNAVQIMTVHAAKGLEFPVVLIPALEREFRHESEPFFHRHLGVGFEIIREEDDGKVGDLTPVVELLREQSNTRSMAEEKRVFYVACTRARDHLILSGTYDPDTRRRSWMRWLSEAIDLRRAMSGGGLEQTVQLQCASLEEGSFKRSSSAHTFLLSVTDFIDAPRINPDGVRLEGDKNRLLNIRINPIEPRPKGEIFSATRIRTYKQCPARYYLQYVLGLPDVLGKAKLYEDDTDERDGKYSAGEFGTLLHSMMEDMENILREQDGIKTGIHRLMRRQTFGEQDDRSLPDKLHRTIEAILDSRCWKEIQKGKESRTEFPVTVAFGSDYLTGTIDRIYKDASGVWNILDYKTDHLRADELPLRAKEYEPQVDFYAFLVARLYDVSDVRSTLLFTEHIDAPITQSYGRADLAAIEKDLLTTLHRIHSADFTPSIVPCTVCPFHPQGCTFHV